MNYSVQSKRIKPNAKSCVWCKNFDIFLNDISCDEGLTKRQFLKCKKEEEYRYCKNYKFSKEKFKRWKEEREELNKTTNLLYL